MRTKILFLSMILLPVSGLFSVAAAIEPISPADTPGSGQGSYNLGIRDITIFCQPPDLNAAVVASQEDTQYPFEAWTADDFYSPTDYAATTVQWWGGHWGYWEICDPRVDYFIITVWPNIDTCFPPYPPDDPGMMLHEEYIYFGEWTEIETSMDRYEYIADIGPVLMDADQWYWLCIQGGLFFEDCGHWGWQPSTETWNCPSVMMFPEIFIDPWEAHGFGDMAFCLYSDESVYSEAGTWGSVKTMYR